MAATSTSRQLPVGYTLRAPRLEDADAVVELMNIRSMNESGKAAISAAWLNLYWGEPDRNLETDDWLVFDPEGQLVAFMELYAFEPFIDFEFELIIRPGFDGHGIDAFLLEQMDARVAKDIHRAPEGARVVLRAWAVSTAMGRREFLEANGFTHIRDSLQMEIELDEERPVDTPDGITIRPFVVGQDDRAVWEVTQAAFADHWGFVPMPYEEFRYYHLDNNIRHDVSLWQVAIDGDRIIGYAICRIDGPGERDIGWISSLGVLREYRGRGIARNMLHIAFNNFHNNGFKSVGLGVDGSSLTGADRLYRNVGMHEVRREYIYEKVLVDGYDDRPT